MSLTKHLRNHRWLFAIAVVVIVLAGVLFEFALPMRYWRWPETPPKRQPDRTETIDLPSTSPSGAGGTSGSATPPGTPGAPLPAPAIPPTGVEPGERADAEDKNTSGEEATVQSLTARIDSLVSGNVGISAPAVVEQYAPFLLVLRVSTGDIDSVLSSLKKEVPENRTVLGGRTKLSSRMIASVSGPGLEVTPAGQVAQTVSMTEPTTWQWRAVANDAGDMVIDFTLVTALTVKGKEYPRNYYFHQPVHIKVAPFGFVMHYWQWFATSLVLPVIGALWALFKGRSKDKAKDAAAPVRKVGRRRL